MKIVWSGRRKSLAPSHISLEGLLSRHVEYGDMEYGRFIRLIIVRETSAKGYV